MVTDLNLSASSEQEFPVKEQEEEGGRGCSSGGAKGRPQVSSYFEIKPLSMIFPKQLNSDFLVNIEHAICEICDS